MLSIFHWYSTFNRKSYKKTMKTLIRWRIFRHKNKDANIHWNDPQQYVSYVMRNLLFAFATKKVQISCALTTQLISSAFVCVIYILQSLYPLNPKFQASSNLLRLVSDLVRNPKDRLSGYAAHLFFMEH